MSKSGSLCMFVDRYYYLGLFQIIEIHGLNKNFENQLYFIYVTTA